MTVSTVTVVTSDGQTINLTYNSINGKWEGSATAPSQTSSKNNAGAGPGVGPGAAGKGYYSHTVTVTDAAGNKTTVNADNETLGSKLRLFVTETTKPIVSITSPTAGDTTISNRPVITLSASDSGSGIKPDSGRLQVDGGAVQNITLTGSGASYTGTYTPPTALADGSHTVTFSASDYDGNLSTTASVTFKIDTTPPSLTVPTPADKTVTNVAKCTVSGTTNDVTSSPVTVAIKLNTVDQGAVEVNADGKFSKDITLKSEGENTIEITSTDSAGKSSTITRTVTLDTKAPLITDVELIEQTTTTGTVYTIRVTCEDD
ncbi:Ig-like domain-containing protein [Candidatus Methanomassiliicoccus intestinalis]|uniref:Ig-like domain protein n=1 Tax=Siphoviridae sp. ctedO8 TaxID=2827907 RepID=A0A8S5T3Z7_9CAUD|nr:MAG TPA: Ig-like domain protein [Siphoviridae sp. ctedO8]